MKPFLRYTLPNGLRVVFAPLHETEAVTVLVATHTGSRYETAAENGVSHFLEHMMFKGTEQRPTTQDVAKELDRIGADFNAFTSKDVTAYYIKAAREHVDLALDIIADMLWHSKFAAEEVERERRVIIEEIHMYHDNPSMHVEDVFEELLFGKNHPLGRNIAGTKKLIGAMRRETVVSYFDRHYFPANMTLCLAGNFSEAKAKRAIAALYGGQRRRGRHARFVPFTPRQAAPRAKLQFRATQQVHLALGFPAYSYTHKDAAALGLLAVILGGNMSSRLFVKVRERGGLCYHISASRQHYEDTGAFVVRSGLDRSRLRAALRIIVDEMKLLKDAGVTAEELANAKDFAKGRLTLQLEDSEQVANYYAAQELFQRRLATPEQRMSEMMRVTAADVARVARAILTPRRANLALIGPFRDAAPFLSELRRL